MIKMIPLESCRLDALIKNIIMVCGVINWEILWRFRAENNTFEKWNQKFWR